MNAKESIMNGKAALGIEFGSTRIKAVLVDENCETLAVGGFHWENQLVDGIWTYSLDAIHSGLQACYAAVAKDVKEKYDLPLKKVASIGISAMMHGYMAFNKKDELLVPFRTWRNTMTEEAAAKLTPRVSGQCTGALQYFSFVSGNLKERRPRKRYYILYNTCRIYPLAAYRSESTWSG